MNNYNYKLLNEIVLGIIVNGRVILTPDSKHANALLSIHKGEANRRKKLKKV